MRKRLLYKGLWSICLLQLTGTESALDALEPTTVGDLDVELTRSRPA